MKRLTLWVALALWLVVSGTGYAQNNADKMNEGNEAYRTGNWARTIELYSSVPVGNADLFYNRANAHFKNEEIGKAILYYNRALRIKPRDKEIRSNLEYARLSRTDKTETEEKSTAVKMAEAIFEKISMNEHAAAAIAIFTILSGLLFSVIYLPESSSRSKLKNAAVITAVVLAFQLIVTGIKTYSESVIRYGVVTVTETAALSSPARGSRKVFELHNGAEVKLGRSENGYMQVELPTGWTGWLPSDAVEKI